MFRRILMIAGLVCLVAAPQALAQIVEGEIRPDNIKRLDFQRPILEYVCAILFLLAAMAIGFMPSKRSANN